MLEPGSTGGAGGDDTSPVGSIADLEVGWWPVPSLHILVVIDGRIKLDSGKDSFGIRWALDTISEAAPPLRVQMQIAHRDPPRRGEDTAAWLDGKWLQRWEFKFSDPRFDINYFDQIWFFVDHPGEFASTDEEIGQFALEEDELRLIARWMDAGGAVFATGDHELLGASACSRIPRVRKMRRWTKAQGVPAANGITRNETLQAREDSADREGDNLLQPVELVQWLTVGTPLQLHDRVHPVMSSSDGPIDRFPDHMHEGELIQDADVELDATLGIAGYDRPEFPVVRPELLGGVVGVVRAPGSRPRPRIIAWGRTTNPMPGEIIAFGDPYLSVSPAIDRTKRFGLVSVYDGQLAGVGRIVCDSTWHHWFNMNLKGIAGAHAGVDYRKIQAYYRNVALWLSGQEYKQSVLIGALGNILMRDSPMAFSGRHTDWELGERAEELLRRDFSPEWINELAAAFVNLTALYAAKGDRLGSAAAPDWSSIPEGVVNRAILGRITNTLMRPVQEARWAPAGKRPDKFDFTALAAEAVRAAAGAPELIGRSLKAAAADLGALAGRLEPTAVNP